MHMHRLIFMVRFVNSQITSIICKHCQCFIKVLCGLCFLFPLVMI